MNKGRTPDHVVFKYLRKNKKFPHIFCQGCGHGIVLGALIRAIDKLKLNIDNLVMVSGIGCSSRAPVYVDFNTLHTLHGRALPFATGIKLANPDLKVIVITGDGDASAIGGNHFIHSCRRNIEITCIVLNNNIYGMTGGQYSPTTPVGGSSATAPFGNIERPFDICDLAVGAGASFVARGTAYHVTGLIGLIEQALQKPGFSVVEAVSQCYTAYGRRNKFKSPSDMLRWQKENSIDVRAWDKLPPEKRAGKIKTGILADHEYTEYTREYQKIIERAAGGDHEKE
ncbi:MAG: 2-oxoacid:ferredoxin oxidoreductase subunit beta [Candidatus Wallbacteria bacterium]|nr:2-oxoacid:ferredoxin oxidoreductase subunit beta [Candidatus Wallbacteria bacterium]